MSSTRLKKEIFYVSSPEHVALCDLHPKVAGRASLVDALIETYGLKTQMKVICPEPCSKNDLLSFHTNDFVECVFSLQQYFEDQKLADKKIARENVDYSEIMEEIDIDILCHGFGYDCEVFPDMYRYIQTVVGATLTAANLLVQSECLSGDIAISLNGGWHHAHVDEVAGFCYVNDIVIGILHLMKKFKKILYIDFDIHHGDGVEEAFKYSNKVLTLSIHKFCNGYFPGTGNIESCGERAGKYHCVNVPLKSGVNDKVYEDIFIPLFEKIYHAYQPDCFVCQCGTDMLVGDPLGGFNLTDRCLANCVKVISEKSLPTLILGGGGYHPANAARCWTRLVSDLLNIELDENIPEHDFLDQYGPDFCLGLSPSNRKNENTIEDISVVVEELADLIDMLKLSQENEAAKEVFDKENKRSTKFDSASQDDSDVSSPPCKRKTLLTDN